jgi:hypothetical protein
VIGDTERQFVDCLQQVKMLGEKDEQLCKELEDVRGAAQELVDMVYPQKKAKQARGPCWSDSAKPRRRCSSAYLKLQSRA